MRSTDVHAIADVAGAALTGVTTLVQDAHEGIAGRPFGILGPAAAPVRVIHDTTAGAVYAGVRGALRAGTRGSALLGSVRCGEADAPLADAPAAARTLGALNGLYGDRLAARRSPLALAMTVRRDGAEVAMTRGALAAAFPATSRLAVFVHGLCETDESWRRPPLRGSRPPARTYGERLEDELGFAGVAIRYNSGLHASHNGRALAALLEELVRCWPCRVERLALVGHSMGGLVARAACHYGAADGQRWTRAVSHVVCLGTPHLGADLEKAVNALGWGLGRLPETRGLARVLNVRSAGVKDLRYGACVDEDWSACDPDEFLRDRCGEVPFLPGATYCFVAASLSDGPLGTLVGDVFVRVPSASGRGGTGRRIPFEADNGVELAGLSHFELLNHPAVYEQLKHRLGGAQREPRDERRPRRRPPPSPGAKRVAMASSRPNTP